jgi:PKD repeat protein
MQPRSLILCLLALSTLVNACKKENDDTNTAIEPIIEANTQEISAGDSVTFKDLSVGYVTKWKWTFEGGTPATSNLSKPTVKYLTPGLYAVTVELSNASNTETLTKTDYIRVDHNQVKTDFTAAPTVIFSGESIAFKDSSSGGANAWQWEFVPVSGGTTLASTQQNPTISFTDTGYYTVKLTASNPSYSDTETKTNFIRVIDPNAVSADFTSASTATYEGGSITFTDQSLGFITGWQWTIEGPVNLQSQDQHPTIQFTTPGRYKVSLKVSNSNTSITKSVDNYILVVPGSSLAAFFPFNGDINDAGPNAVSASSLGAGVQFINPDRLSQAGNTGTFNGATGVVVNNHSAFNFGANDYTVSCWIKTGITSRMMIWQESGKNGSGDNQTWLRMGDNATDRRLRFTIEDNTGSAIINMGATAFVADNIWHHVVAVRQGTTTTVYIDGVQRGTLTTGNLKLVSNDQHFKIGVQEGAASNSSFFNGEIDDMIIYNKALTLVEITALFNL